MVICSRGQRCAVVLNILSMLLFVVVILTKGRAAQA